MNKTIIAVYGRANEGKSETIKKTCELLILNFPNAVPNPLVVNYNGDILVTVQLGNYKIGFESQGDPKSRMIHEDTIRKLADKKIDPNLGGFDIIICATRTSGETVDKVDVIANQYSYNTLWKSSYYTPNLNRDVLNKKAAEEIIELITALITGQL
jgi:hypothetical protein